MCLGHWLQWGTQLANYMENQMDKGKQKQNRKKQNKVLPVM